MRRFLLTALLTAASMGLVVPAASATTNHIVSYKGLPSDWSALSVPCSSGSPVAYQPVHVSGPTGAPAGEGSEQFAGSSTSSPVVLFGPTDSPPLSTLSAIDAWVYVPTTGGATPDFDIEVSEGSVDYSLYVDESGTGWVHVDLTGPTVLSYHSYDNQTNTNGASGTSTLSDFASAHPSATFTSFGIAPTVCGPGSYYLDDVHYAVGSTDNTVDFEAPTSSALTNSTHPTSVLTGAAVTLTAHLTSEGTALGGQPVGLYAHSVGGSWHVVKTLTSDSTGAISLRVNPTSTTTYQWRYAATGTNYAPATGTASTIVSCQRVSVSSRPTSTPYRRTAVIKGRIAPTKSGVTVQLIRLASGKRLVVASSRTATGGYFMIKALMTARGTYNYLVAAIPYTGEALGQSATFRIVTR